MQPERPMTTVRKDDLDILVVACLKYLPDDLDEDVSAAFGRLDDARHQGADPIPGADPRPDGFWGRVEIAGYRDATGWVTDEPRFGLQMAVVRDWDGRVIDEFAMGPNSRIEHLPTPMKRPGPRAITASGSAAEGDAGDPDEYLTGDDDEDEF